jgi:spore coat protein U-like protein
MRVSSLARYLLGCMLAASVLGAAHAQSTATAVLAVTATVVPSCIITTLPLAFGPYSGAAVNASGSVVVTCTTGAGGTVTLGQGGNPGSGSTDAAPVRRMSDGTNFLSYALYSDTGRSTVWGNTVSTGKAVTGTGLAETHTVYGTIPASQLGVPTGAYADTVLATITF